MGTSPITQKSTFQEACFPVYPNKRTNECFRCLVLTRPFRVRPKPSWCICWPSVSPAKINDCFSQGRSCPRSSAIEQQFASARETMPRLGRGNTGAVVPPIRGNQLGIRAAPLRSFAPQCRRGRPSSISARVSMRTTSRRLRRRPVAAGARTMASRTASRASSDRPSLAARLVAKSKS